VLAARVALPLSSRPLFAAESTKVLAMLFYAGTILSLLVAAAAVWFAVRLFQQILAKDPGDEAMQKIAREVQNGARAFLHAEYRWLLVFAAIAFVLICLGPGDKGLGIGTAVAFLLGASASAGAGYFGMHCSTRAAVRTTQAAKSGIAAALDIAFKSGTVMGFTVVGFGLIGISLLLLVNGVNNLAHVLGFSFGASSIALFARVGGGIYTKAADVGGDLVGKLEAGIPEDDPRNPAVIADNVGDNVGDVAGMGADLFESYVGAIISTAIIGFAAAAGTGHELADNQGALVVYPLLLSAVGVVASWLGTFRVRADDESRLSAALFDGLVAASGLLIVGGGLVTWIVRPHPRLADAANAATASSWGVYFAMVIGLVLGVAIGKVTEYYTSEKMAPAQTIAQQSRTGPATNIIHGLANGMASTWIPVLLLAIAIWMGLR
jgi:K(+)-stimulated pyrophosphate-energized sodium pump